MNGCPCGAGVLHTARMTEPGLQAPRRIFGLFARRRPVDDASVDTGDTSYRRRHPAERRGLAGFDAHRLTPLGVGEIDEVKERAGR